MAYPHYTTLPHSCHPFPAANPGEVTGLGFGEDPVHVTEMQEMNYYICNNNRPGTTGQLKDNRDGKVYWVTKLADGNCWMTQNLDYDDPNSTKITNPSSWTSTDANYRAYYDPGLKIVSGSSLANAGSSDTHLLVGNYYSWQSATNGTGSSQTSNGGIATGSICPAGWQLPLSHTNNNGISSSFYNLLSKYNLASAPTNGSNSISGSPLYFQFGGGVWSGTLNNAGSNGYYWSSTARDGTYAYNLYFDSSLVNPSRSTGRYAGQSVRCLVQGS